jgi:hypothetical protein
MRDERTPVDGVVIDERISVETDDILTCGPDHEASPNELLKGDSQRAP